MQRPDSTVTVGQLVEYLSAFDPDSPLILRDASHYDWEQDDPAAAEKFVSVEQAMYELGARPAD
jgi:hypothetical protein